MQANTPAGCDSFQPIDNKHLDVFLEFHASGHDLAEQLQYLCWDTKGQGFVRFDQDSDSR
jgi:hypothetical protein